MKTKNMPARKLRRQLIAVEGPFADLKPEHKLALDAARSVRTKKDRSNRAKF